MTGIRQRRFGERGFTLIELMIVVAIVGILASVAMPAFSRYQNRSKSAEAKVNLSALRVAEESYFNEHGVFLPANPQPALIPGARPMEFDATSSGYALLGWVPNGRVYFSYAVIVTADQTGYTADAGADIDGDGIVQIWGFSKPSTSGAVVNGGLGCDVSRLLPNTIGPCMVGSTIF
ncbi:MAG: prepilin-type N-terminal cleavage/methylation domain-containing protein [Deltaproteobacteria bacterium]|nr:prepilin-type N-terminal cleavage/methylation domain-containing protein [Deltaproteobacteria bacterium]MBW2397095.1 prepilin-type N-terminal cleavage/methylation domain-containing protein [Deltaproteobacteria bacterium]